jgi:DNA replication protein DnaC
MVLWAVNPSHLGATRMREVFPNAACVVSLVDRLLHHAEIVSIEGDSYRLKEARDRTDQRAHQRPGGKS